jgi:tetratricopeptide (TPR) repeat protein
MRLPALGLCVLLAAAPTLAGNAGMRTDGMDGGTLNEEAMRCLERGELDRAIALFGDARRVAPEDATIRRNLAVAHNNRGLRLVDRMEFARAISDFESATSLVEDEPLFRVHLGYAHLKRLDFPRAEMVLGDTVKHFPSEPKGYQYLGFLYYSDDELERAIELFEQRLALADDSWTRSMLEKARREQAVAEGYEVKTSNDFVLKFLGEGDNDAIAEDLLAVLEDARARIGSELGCFPQRRTTVLLYTKEDFRRATGAHEWVGGLYDGKIRLPVRDFARQREALFATARHEYTHRVLNELCPEVPIWLNEGLADWYGTNGRDPHRDFKTLLREGGTAPSFAGLSETFAKEQDAKVVRVQYAASYSFTSFLRDRYGLACMRAILLELRAGKNIDDACRSAIGYPLEDLEKLWRREVLDEAP